MFLYPESKSTLNAWSYSIHPWRTLCDDESRRMDRVSVRPHETTMMGSNRWLVRTRGGRGTAVFQFLGVGGVEEMECLLITNIDEKGTALLTRGSVTQRRVCTQAIFHPRRPIGRSTDRKWCSGHAEHAMTPLFGNCWNFHKWTDRTSWPPVLCNASWLLVHFLVVTWNPVSWRVLSHRIKHYGTKAGSHHYAAASDHR